jgi:hypothetical protein
MSAIASPTRGQHGRDVQPDPTAVIHRGETAPGQRRRHGVCGPHPVGKKPNRDRASQRHHTRPDLSAVTDNPRDHEVGFTGEVPSRQEESNPKQVRFFPYLQGTSATSTLVHSITHE